LEAQATSDLETLDGLLAPDFVYHTLPLDQDPGRVGYLPSRCSVLLHRGLLRPFLDGFSRLLGEWPVRYARAAGRFACSTAHSRA
jgi:hypothetical protein